MYCQLQAEAGIIKLMQRTLIIDCVNNIDQQVLIKGWVWIRRDHGKIVFLDIIDRSGLLQVVCTAEQAGDLRAQDVVEIEGKIVNRPEKLINLELKTGTIEMQANMVKVLAKAEELPFDMGVKELDLQLPTLLDYRSLTLRHPKIKAIFKVQEVVIDAFREALKRKDFTEYQSPVIIPQTAEGGAEVFEVKYFNEKAYLSQSPQFYKQIMVGVFERVFSVAKTLRAEPSMTTRHLTEANTLDAEFGFIEDWRELMDMAEYVIKFIFDRVDKECKEELAVFGTKVPQVSEILPRLKLREAQQIIFERTGRDCRNEDDLAPEDEREICKWALEEKGSELVFITHYLVKKKPFYTVEDPEDPGFVKGFDLLGRGTEWLTGSQRINDYQKLSERAKEWGVDLSRSELYMQAFRYGMPPEGGFSFGSERIVMHILGLQNIREASAFPRDMERVDVRLSTLKK